MLVTSISDKDLIEIEQNNNKCKRYRISRKIINRSVSFIPGQIIRTNRAYALIIQLRTPHLKTKITSTCYKAGDYVYFNFWMKKNTTLNIPTNILKIYLEDLSDTSYGVRKMWHKLTNYHQIKCPPPPPFPKFTICHPLVSVIITTYNGADYLQYSVKSILNQTYKPIELIIINDGSTDNTHEICQKFLKSNVIYHKNETNIGTYASRNLAITMASGEIIAFQDDDDISCDDRIELQVKKMKKGYLMVMCNYLRIYDQNSYLEIANAKTKVRQHKTAHLRRIRRGKNGLLTSTNQPSLACVTTCYHRQVFNDIGPFMARYKAGGDMEMIERFMAYYMGLTFTKELNPYILCSYCPSIDGIFSRINSVLYMALYRNEGLTSNYGVKGGYKTHIKKEYRQIIKETIIEKKHGSVKQYYNNLNISCGNRFDPELVEKLKK